MPSGNETTTKFKVDITELKKGIQEANRQIRLANAEFKAASSGMENWGKSADGVQRKIEQLEAVLSSQKKILESYEKQLALVTEQYGENSKEADEMRIRVANQQAVVNKTNAELNGYKNTLQELIAEQAKAAGATEDQSNAYEDLKKTIASQESELKDLKSEYAAVILEQGKNSDSAKELAGQIDSLSTELADNKKAMDNADKAADDLDKSLDEVGDSAQDAGSGGFTVLKGALANLVADGIELAISGLKRLGKEIINVGKQSISNYAEYEQLVGGVETLFKNSAGIVQGYAENAFRTAGLSANEYMETVTSFSASLLQGLNGDTARAAKIADQAITDMSDNANKMGTDMSMLQSAYQGFAKQNYTMLDNLKLGYGGTASEMARLINDSGVLGDSMEVTAETVKNVSFDKMIEAIHVVQTEMGITGTTAMEAASTIEGSKNAMQAAWQNLLTGLADDDADIEDLLNKFMDSAETYLNNMLPRVEKLVDNVIGFARDKLAEKAPELLEFFDTINEGFTWITDHSTEIIAAVAGIGTAFAVFAVSSMGVTGLMEALMGLEIVQKAVTAAQWLMNLAMDANPIGIIIALIAGLVAAFMVFWNNSEEFREFWIGLWEKVQDIAKKAWAAISGFFTDAWTWIQDTWSGLTEFFGGLWKGIQDIFSGIASWINDYVFQPIINIFKPVLDFYITSWKIMFELAKACWEAIKIVWSVVKDWFTKNIIEPVKNYFSQMWENIKNNAMVAWNFIKGVWNVVSGWFNDKIIAPVQQFFGGMWDKVKNGAKDAWEGIKSVFSVVTEWFQEKFSQAWQRVKDVFSTGGRIFDGIKEGITEAFKSVVNAIIRGINKVISIPFNAINNMLDKIRNVSIAGMKPFEGLISRFEVPQIPELAQGGILKKGQMGLLEGNGAEAVVPLDRNKKWIAATARDLKSALISEGVLNVNGVRQTTVNNNYNFVQNNTSPKALSKLDIYRQTKNQLAFAGGVSNV